MDLLRDVLLRDRDVQLVIEQLGDVLPSHVQRGTDDVARALAGFLDDPLAEVGLDALDTLALKEMIELDLLGDHRFGLDDLLCLMRAADFERDPVGVTGIAGVVDDGPGLFGRLLELGEVIVEPILDAGLSRLELGPQPLEFDLLERGVAVDAPVALVAGDVGGQARVVERGLVPLGERLDHMGIVMFVLRSCVLFLSRDHGGLLSLRQ